MNVKKKWSGRGSMNGEKQKGKDTEGGRGLKYATCMYLKTA
jgi:hypothetical protein